MTTERTVIVPDLQVPQHSPKHVDTLARFIEATQPVRVASVGDEADFTGISRWADGTPLMYETNLDREREATISVLRQLHVTDMMRSNHTDRLFNIVKMKVPQFRHLPELDLAKFLRLDELGITYHRKPVEIVPGWLLAHGDEGSLSQTGGMTALGLARKWGKSVVAGHTHRMGLLHHTTAVNGEATSTLWGMEVGNLMDMRKASYLKAGSANWHVGFGVLDVSGRRVQATLVPMQRDGSFIVDGREWR